MKISRGHLDFKIESHRKWLNGEDGGKRESFKGMDLSNIDLKGVNLSYADFTDCNLDFASFRGSNLRCVDFSNSSMRDANFDNSVLTGADLSDVDLTNTYFKFADLSSANLRGAYFENTDFEKANLRYVGFTRSADFGSCHLSQANVNKTFGFYSVDSIGTFDGKITFHAPSNRVWAGCWSGNLGEFKKRCREVWKADSEHKTDLKMCYSFFLRKLREYNKLKGGWF